MTFALTRNSYQTHLKIRYRVQDQIVTLEAQIEQAQHHLHNLTAYALLGLKGLRKAWGLSRKTNCAQQGAARMVANETHHGLQRRLCRLQWKKLMRCASALTQMTSWSTIKPAANSHKVSEKAFFAKPALRRLFNRASKWKHFCLVYRDGKKGATQGKYFTIGGITRIRCTI